MKVKELKPGQVFKYAGYKWIKLEQEGFVLMKDILEERAFDNECNDWRESELNEYLHNYFHETLNKNGAKDSDLQLIETDLTADDGMKDYETSKDLISIMTADLYRSNRHLLRPLESWWWLATPYSCLASYSCRVRCVTSSGALYNSACNGYYGVRPLIRLYDSAEVLVDEEKTSATAVVHAECKGFEGDELIFELEGQEVHIPVRIIKNIERG